MTHPQGRISVDPDGVVAVGNDYAAHVALYQTYLDQLASIRERYASSWGDDEMGTKFSEKFLRGMDNLESLLKGVKGTLNYAAEGLRTSGNLYREVDDEAREAGHHMAADFETHLPNPTRGDGTTRRG